ncbi:MAG: hypothetical protein QG625_2498 [Cyanobacteriota bacterium erpe_2018_sw_39hr_WHONDRS-SW48-000098_B_bin.30]|jgi:hypothetical protein|nr:hypothetical protein [Candidatus Obscuribacter sp.]MBK7840804.1 hypothetical protein [Candidatus Obscuribacter sp.]MDQ5966343.1 hypothetical protein [Cyanobacteriota bacterium erpe_2018_sw_39hr_WHONDRS-SW48-000098_B_bin.30]
MNNKQAPSFQKLPRVHKFFTSTDWSAASLALAFATYLMWFGLASDFSAEQILSATVVFIVVSGVVVGAAACLAASWRVLFRATASWLIAGGSLAFAVFFICLLTVSSQYQAAAVMGQYAQSVISQRSNDQEVISLNAVKSEIAEQKRLYYAVKVLTSLEEVLKEVDSDILSSQELSEFGSLIDKRKGEFKARQMDDVRLLVRFVRYSRFVCHDVQPVSSGQPADQVCSLKEMLDYGQALPAKYPRWIKILRWLSLI